MGRGQRTLWIVIGILVVVVLIPFLYVKSTYNTLVRMDEQVKAAWAQVENQLQRRYDLIPNYVETVKGYAKHEKELFENIAQARTRYFQSDSVKSRIENANRLEGALSRLLLLVERYPDLKANESFLKLQDSLEGTENRIAVERKRYNEAVQALNTYIRTFFGRFYAMLAGVSPAEYYKLPKGQAEAPKVKF